MHLFARQQVRKSHAVENVSNSARDKDFPATLVYFLRVMLFFPHLPVWAKKQLCKVISYLLSVLENYMSL